MYVTWTIFSCNSYNADPIIQIIVIQKISNLTENLNPQNILDN